MSMKKEGKVWPYLLVLIFSILLIFFIGTDYKPFKITGNAVLSPASCSESIPSSGNLTIENKIFNCSNGNLSQVSNIILSGNSSVIFENISYDWVIYSMNTSNFTLNNSNIEQLQVDGNSSSIIKNTSISKITFGDNSTTTFVNSNISGSIGVFGNPFFSGSVFMPPCYEVHSWALNANLTRGFGGYLYNRTIPMNFTNITYDGNVSEEYNLINLTTTADGKYNFNVTYNRTSYKGTGFLLNPSKEDENYMTSYFAAYSLFRNTPINTSYYNLKINLTEINGTASEVNYSINLGSEECSNIWSGFYLLEKVNSSFFEEVPSFDFLMVDVEDAVRLDTKGQFNNSITNKTQIEVLFNQNSTINNFPNQDVNLTIPLIGFRNDRFFDSPLTLYPFNLTDYARAVNFTQLLLHNESLNTSLSAYYWREIDDITQWRYSPEVNITLQPLVSVNNSFVLNFSEEPSGNYTVVSQLIYGETNKTIGFPYESFWFVKENEFQINLVKDTDGDGIPDDVSLDKDGDGVNNSLDTLNGNVSNIITNLNNLTFEIDGNSNLSKNFSGLKNISLNDSNGSLISFPFNFSSTNLDLGQVIIKKESSNSSLGGIVIKGIELGDGLTKTVYMDRLSNSSSICIRDMELASLDQVSDNCVGTDEILLSCDGVQYGSYTCTNLSNKFKIEGLVHSGIKEYNPLVASESNNTNSCTESWSCSSWSSCSGGTQTKTCTDLNSCGTTLNKPSTSQSCSSGGSSGGSSSSRVINLTVNKTSNNSNILPVSNVTNSTIVEKNKISVKQPTPEETSSSNSSEVLIIVSLVIIVVILLVAIISMTIHRSAKKKKQEQIKQEIRTELDTGRKFLELKDKVSATKYYSVIKERFVLLDKKDLSLHDDILKFYNEIINSPQ